MEVLVCTACESGAGPQLPFASILGSIDPSTALTLLHVLPHGGDPGAAERCLSEAREKLEHTTVEMRIRQGDPFAQILEQRQVPAELRLRYGVVADEIVREAREGNNDLVLVGAAKGRMQLKRLMLGEVTEQVVQRSPRSVLVVRKPLRGGR